jgi:PEP-CTERM motif
MNARSMICASAIALVGGLSVSAPSHAALTLIVAAGGGGGAGLQAIGLGGQITTSGGDGVGGGAGGTSGSGGNAGTAGGGAGWLSNGGLGLGGVGGSTSPSFAGGAGFIGFSFGGFGGGGGGGDVNLTGGGGGGGYSGGGGGDVDLNGGGGGDSGGGGGSTGGGGGGGSYVNSALGDVLETLDVNAGNGYVLVGTTYFGYTGSVEEYTIPKSAFYFVAAIGAQGGSGNAGAEAGGDGAAVGGEVYLTQGTDLDIVVGGAGTSIAFDGGGGGGSFVWDPVAIPVQPVPEPSTWAMMLLGFAGLGYAGWRAGGRPFSSESKGESAGEARTPHAPRRFKRNHREGRPRSRRPEGNAAALRGAITARAGALGGFGFGLQLGALLGDFALELDRVLGELRLVGLDEEIVEAAAMLDRTQGRRGDAQAHRALKQIRGERDLDEVRQEARARLAVGMADLVAGLNGDPSQLAAACHRTTILQTNASAGCGKYESGPLQSRSAPPAARPG